MSVPVDSPTRNSTDPQRPTHRRKGRRSTREKIEKLVAEGAKNYPAYLKLIYTGDSEQSSEEESNTEAAKVEVTNPFETGAARENPGSESGGGGGRVAPEGGGRILSPESDKLLDPGSEKPAEGSTIAEGTSETEEKPLKTATEEAYTETDNSQQQKQCNDNEPEEDSNQQSVEEKWKVELFQLQDDIISLKAMLNGKLQIASDLKHRLGITPIAEFKQSFFSFKESGTFIKTNAVLKSLGAYASRKMGSIRNSVVFKSVEAKVVKVKSRSMGHIKTRLHRKLSGSKSESNVSDLKSNDHDSISNTDEEIADPLSPVSSPQSIR